MNKSALLLWVVVLPLAMLAIGLQKGTAWSNESTGVVEKKVAKAAQDFELIDLEGKRHALSEWAGQPLLINYWASWCGPCIKEMPDLDAFSKSQANVGGVRVIGIATDKADAVRAFLKRVPVSFPILVETIPESGRGSATLFGDTGGVLPYSVLLDAQGRVVHSKLGSVSSAELESWVKSIHSSVANRPLQKES